MRSQALPEDSLDRSVSSLQKNSETAKIGLGATKKEDLKVWWPIVIPSAKQKRKKYPEIEARLARV